MFFFRREFWVIFDEYFYWSDLWFYYNEEIDVFGYGNGCYILSRSYYRFRFVVRVFIRVKFEMGGKEINGYKEWEYDFK